MASGRQRYTISEQLRARWRRQPVGMKDVAMASRLLKNSTDRIDTDRAIM
jgi:hypothetical protein